MRAIGSLTHLTRWIIIGVLLFWLASCATKSYSDRIATPRKFEGDIIYFVGLDGLSFSLKSIDGFKTAMMKESSGQNYLLVGISSDCMAGDVKVCFNDKYAAVEFLDGRVLKAVPVPVVKE